MCGLLWRLCYASDFYLNPDEALHYMVAAHDWHGWVGFYRTAIRVVHPPLFIAVLRGVLLFGRSERVLRFVSMGAGALFPWFVMLWVQRLAGSAAGLCAQLFLTFSPTLIDLSTEVRAYTLAFLFLSIGLVLLEQALDSGSARHMAWFHAFLYLAILTEYCVAWFAAALGIYALLRLWRSRAPNNVRIVWMLGQIGVLGLYTFLYVTQVSGWPRSGLLGMYNTWLREAFPQPNENLLVFAVKGSIRQFRYMLQVPALAWLGAIAFPFGLYRLWRDKSPLHAILIVLPFFVGCSGAVLRLFPFGATRHTAILGIAIVAGLGTAVAGVTRNKILPILVAAIPIILVWNWWATDLYLPTPRYRRQLSSMREAIRFLRTNVPSGSVIVTDGGTDQILGYYLGCPDYRFHDSDERYRMRQCVDLRIVVGPFYQFDGPADLREEVFDVQHKYHLDQPVWVAAAGFDINVSNPVSDSRPFGKTIAIFQTSDSPPADGAR
jgi:Dolichyl-phosphate-mannose-protein mannosyltransferase